MISGVKEPIEGYRGIWDNHVEWLDIHEVEAFDPPNDPCDVPRLIGLKEDMIQNGWKGPPLLLLSFDDGENRLLQGSHRIAAAREAGLPRIPFLIIRGEDPLGDSPFQTAYDLAKLLDPELADAVAEISEEQR